MKASDSERFYLFQLVSVIFFWCTIFYLWLIYSTMLWHIKVDGEDDFICLKANNTSEIWAEKFD